MSGLVGVVHFDGSAADPNLLAGLTASMSSCGPDGLHMFYEGAVGLGSAKLATTEEALREVQPLSLDGEVWVVADARIDDRQRLKDDLEDRGCQGVDGATDAELILHAYGAWGIDAATHLLGDFAFALWDGRRQQLYCARDHFGIKPFYYTEGAGRLVLSNHLNSLRRHPQVSSSLDSSAIGDFLLFEWNLNPQTTTFADIRRLPPAHQLIYSAAGLELRRYWRLPISGPPEMAPDEGWVERFRSLLWTAVEDRLRTDRVAMLMSGGLDSTAVAAAAHAVQENRGVASDIACFTCGYQRLMDDPEREYAQIAARSLSASFHFRTMDDYRLAGRWGELPLPPEPANLVLDAFTRDFDHQIAAFSRVALTGFGGDSILLASRDFFLQQIRTGRLPQAIGYLAGSLRRDGRLPPLGLATRWQRWRLRRNWREGYPSWLDENFEKQLALENRWRWYCLERGPDRRHPNRPEAFIDLLDITWCNSFEQVAGTASGKLEYRNPFFDLRLVEYLLQVPPVPWCLDKRLLRDAMQDFLPDAVRLRRKTSVSGLPVHPSGRSMSGLWQELMTNAPEVVRYVRPKSIQKLLEHQEATSGVAPYPDPVYRPLSLAYWLAGVRDIKPMHRTPKNDKVTTVNAKTFRPARPVG